MREQSESHSLLRLRDWPMAMPSFVYSGRSDRIRTYDPLIPNQMRYQAALRSDESEILAGLGTRGQSQCESMPIAVRFARSNSFASRFCIR